MRLHRTLIMFVYTFDRFWRENEVLAEEHIVEKDY